MTRTGLVLLVLGVIVPTVQADPGSETVQTARHPAISSVSVTSMVRPTVRRDADGWWFVSPRGERFFSLGVSVMNQGTSRADHNPIRPSYAAWRHYDRSEAWSDASLRRLKSWRFTTVGGWSDWESLRKSSELDLWCTPVVHLGSQAGAPWWDMWDKTNLAPDGSDRPQFHCSAARRSPSDWLLQRQRNWLVGRQPVDADFRAGAHQRPAATTDWSAA